MEPNFTGETALGRQRAWAGPCLRQSAGGEAVLSPGKGRRRRGSLPAGTFLPLPGGPPSLLPLCWDPVACRPLEPSSPFSQPHFSALQALTSTTFSVSHMGGTCRGCGDLIVDGHKVLSPQQSLLRLQIIIGSRVSRSSILTLSAPRSERLRALPQVTLLALNPWG